MVRAICFTCSIVLMRRSALSISRLARKLQRPQSVSILNLTLYAMAGDFFTTQVFQRTEIYLAQAVIKMGIAMDWPGTSAIRKDKCKQLPAVCWARCQIFIR